MQSADPATLFQTDASLATGLKRALKWKETSSGAEWGHPIWLHEVSSASTSANSEEVTATNDTLVALTPAPSKANRSSDVKGKTAENDVDVKERAARGAAIDAGRNKVLDMQVLTEEGIAFVAEGGGSVRAVNLENASSLASFRAGTGPCFCLCRSRKRQRLLVACSSWDKTLRIYPFDTTQSSNSQSTKNPFLKVPDAGSDIIKALGFDERSRLLFTGGSDLHVRAWDLEALLQHIESLDEESWDRLRTGATSLGSALAVKSIGYLRGHTRPVTRIISLSPPPTAESALAGGSERNAVIFSADSLGRILESRVTVREGRADIVIRRELRGHETSIGDLKVLWSAEETGESESQLAWSAVLWSASNDRHALCFHVAGEEAPVKSSSATQKAKIQIDRSSKAGAVLGTEPPCLASNSLFHDDFALAVLPLPSEAGMTVGREDAQLVFTGTASEDVYTWDAELASHGVPKDEKRRDIVGNALPAGHLGNGSNGLYTQQAGLIRRQQGHWHEVTSLGLWHRKATGPFADVESKEETGEAEKKAEKKGHYWLVSASYDGSIRRWALEGIVKPNPVEEPKKAVEEAKPVPSNGMTAEEEAELAELLSDEE